MEWTNVRKIFKDPQGRLMYYWGNSDDNVKLIHKGDFVRYKTTHISTVYSDMAEGCTANANGQSQCSYDIIHANGADGYTKKVGTKKEIVFSRQVMVTPNNISTLSNPTGFGRIKLWD